jgi:hypothetical protein
VECPKAQGHMPMFFFAFSVTKKGRNRFLLREASAPRILRASYAPVWLRCGKFLISDPGVSFYKILTLRTSATTNRS